MKKELFGIEIDHISYQEYISSSISLKSGYSCFLNSHMLYEHYKSTHFVGVLSKANFVLPDGVPLLYSMRLFHGVNQQRIAGNDVISSLFDKAEAENLRVFLFGSTHEVLGKISIQLTGRDIVHKTYSPPFRPIDNFDFEYHAALINDFDADIILVGLGCPKQEIWMSRMRGRVKGHMYGLGGAFLLYAGIDSRAPKILRNLALEWLYRLALEPRRLFRRYLYTNSFFCMLMIKEVILRFLFRK